MDPVSAIIEGRERRTQRRGPWIATALALHAGVLLAVVAAARMEPARPLHLPTVDVQLVQAPPSGRRPSGAAPVPTARPEPTPVPEPIEPPPEPTAAPVQEPEPDDIETSESAMSEPTPGPTATPRPKPAGTGSGSASHGGLSLGGEGGGTPGPAIPSDFRFTYYIQRMLALIETRWYKPAVPAGTQAMVRFRIHRSGRVDDIAIESSSGVAAFDRAALRALYGANPLPPLPPGYAKPHITVHLRFTER